MTLRITGGIFRNRKIQAPKGTQTRPTLEKVRKAVFDKLQQKCENALFLDLFAGSGAMGLEAVSRGAKGVVFVEYDRLAIDCLKKNINSLEIENQCQILKGKAEQILNKLQSPFDIIYIDPPYEKGYAEKILELIDKNKLLAENGILFVEERAPLKNLSLINLELKQQKTYGSTKLYQFEQKS
ncbi:MAG: 16S rRNA (guanine(966)-N(2))-methyltransferase RsmD [Simkaniaceae bacterium]|nr:16S rRNA (guanine(966)-N(2))-methyltransferase RsmD [Simkaniaceae bacterium]